MCYFTGPLWGRYLSLMFANNKSIVICRSDLYINAIRLQCRLVANTCSDERYANFFTRGVSPVTVEHICGSYERTATTSIPSGKLCSSAVVFCNFTKTNMLYISAAGRRHFRRFWLIPDEHFPNKSLKINILSGAAAVYGTGMSIKLAI